MKQDASSNSTAQKGLAPTTTNNSRKPPELTIQGVADDAPQREGPGPQIYGVTSVDKVPGIEAPSDSDEEEEETHFRRFTSESYIRLLEREAEAKRKEEERKTRPNEGRLVDGELRFDGDDEDDAVKERNSLLLEGNNLPESYGEVANEFISTPLEELDPAITDKVSCEKIHVKWS